jgi:hypothetical protein
MASAPAAAGRGHRLYQDGDISLVGDVLPLRASGLGLQAAAGQVAERVADIEPFRQ